MGDSETETLGILEEIQALVSDKLQVVSYKWLSRNFLLSSNASKRMLQAFVEKHGNGLEIVYTLSGWLKNNPSVYHIRLVCGPKLEEAKKEFDGNCSVQVYSVQACIPKDPAALWNAEFVQAEELCRQPPTIDNCLRDNRFCGISNFFVKRNVDGTALSTAAPQPKTSGLTGLSRSNSTNQNVATSHSQQKKVQQSSPKVSVVSPNVVKDVKTESHITGGQERPPEKEKVPQLPANKKKAHKDKNTSGNGGSLANMWDRASIKLKPGSTTKEANNTVSDATASAEAQIYAQEATEAISSDDDDGLRVNLKRASNGEGSRKRRVVLDFSDEEAEYKDAVNLASPDPPKRQSFLNKESIKSSSPEKNNLATGREKDNKLNVKEDNVSQKSKEPSREDSSIVSKGKTSEVSPSDNVHNPENNIKSLDKVNDAPSTSPKRRKVLKTEIDERGREVTKVVWEGQETEAKADGNTVKKEDKPPSNNISGNRPEATKKSPAVGTTAPSKAGNKKAGNPKDPKQGNIMSFFRRV
ncbi:uncharacterized protein LOC127792615 [Diospyros lotus]|uniref:uncharacterized protein LOC127792615 n=1 Tax=Diospyros lotus TaxID=55363 RepID=UPI002251F917|nr:uncharacterized protein LOC127792615 [Diospyros lotus]